MGMMSRTIQAPAVNFSAAVITKTIAVITVPTALITIPRCQPGFRRRRQRATMPAWAMVKAMKTPMV